MFASGLVNVFTDDISAAVRFYRDLLGLPETFRTPTEGTPEHVELAAGGFTIGLGTVAAARRVHGLDAAPGTPAMSIVLWCEDVDGELAALREAGVPVVTEPRDSGNGNRNAVVRDPDGTLVELVSKRHAQLGDRRAQVEEALGAERESLSPGCRADADRMRALLAPDFHEFGSSGGELDFAETPERVAAQSGPDVEPIGVERLRGTWLADGVVMVKYLSVIDGRRANRTSLWRRVAPGRWQMFHHQGTPTG